jgi:predicted outer membrane repeat protein
MLFSIRSKTSSARPSISRHCRPRCEILEGRALLATFHVADVAGLQAAVAAVNNDPSKHATILLAPGTYDLTNELQIVNARDLTIERDSSGPVVVDNPTHSDRIFEIDGGDVTIDGLSISGGAVSDNGGGIYASLDTTLTVSNSEISGNSARYNYGGGIYGGGTLTVSNTTVSGNSSNLGGGIFGGGTLTVSNTTIFGNSAATAAGGIYGAGGTLTVSNTTIFGNSSPYGGGIYGSGGTLTVSYSTGSGNSASYGGGIFGAGTVTISNSTVSGNSASYGGGIYASYRSVVEITNSTLNDANGGGIFNNSSTIHLMKTVVDGILYIDQFYP